MSIQEGEDYKRGWHIAERGGPFPQWTGDQAIDCSITEQRIGWVDYHNQECQK